jgi:hypothetical protein
VRAKFVVELQMVPLGKQMQIHLAHDEAVGVGIVGESRRAVPAGQVDPITGVAPGVGQRGLEKSFRAEPVRFEALLVLS